MNDYYIAIPHDDYVIHHGVQGMKWGIRNGPPYPLYEKKVRSTPALQRLRNAKTSNLDNWGKAPQYNTLYITGYSGSGKSTVASFMADDGKTDWINLDSYLSPMGSSAKASLQNKSFNSYLDKQVKNWNQFVPTFKKNKKEGIKISDQIVKAMDEWSSQQYKNGRKVICEGVQIADKDFLRTDQHFYDDKPLIILQTSREESARNGSLRDGVRKDMIDKVIQYKMEYSSIMNKSLKDLEKSSSAKRGEEWVKNYIRNVEVD